MSTTEGLRVSPGWLATREAADAAARATDLLDPLGAYLARVPRPTGRLVVRDLGCGTGSLGRWLAVRLRGRQHWILHDRDPRLLDLALARMPRTAADGATVTAETRQADLTRLTAADLAGTTLVSASALLDLLTHDEVHRLATATVAAGCPALLALSVAGRVELEPADPLDTEVAAAFDAHQRRAVPGRGLLLGPDGAAVAAEAFGRRGAVVRSRPAPWRLGAGRTALLTEWLGGWVAAARVQRPDLAPRLDAYLRRRLDACTAGALRAVVHHTDVLALPAPSGGDAS